MKRGACGVHACSECARLEEERDDLAFLVGGLLVLLGLVVLCALVVVFAVPKGPKAGDEDGARRAAVVLFGS